MTYREKLAKEHPEKIDDKEWGGCKGCPSSYGYEPLLGCSEGGNENCTACWDREIPEKNPPISPQLMPFRLAYLKKKLGTSMSTPFISPSTPTS